MNRLFAMLAIGLFLGTGIGFVIAASQNISLDGHDHSESAHAGTANHGDHEHGQPLILPNHANAPSIDIEVVRDPKTGWNLHIITENFRWAPENASRQHVAGEGHAHVYVNDRKIARQYGDWLHIGKLPKGMNEIKVSLNTNDHRALIVGDQLLQAIVVVEGN